MKPPLLRAAKANERRWRTQCPPATAALRSWLREAGSLSRRLAMTAPGFHVRVLGERRCRPLPGETRALGQPARLWLWERDVLLCSHDQAFVYAHTVSRSAARDAAWPLLRHLGGRPLGHLLFEVPGVRRSALVFRRLRVGEALHQRITIALGLPLPPLWVRRSLFALRGRRLLVSEVFLPAMTTLAPNADPRER